MSQEYDISSPTIRSFVFLDLETTGLLQREGKNCHIVELCLVAVLREHFLDQCEPFPRVLNKMSLCFNPCRFMDATAMSIHGLSNTLLQDMPPLSPDDYVLISTFLNKLPSPVCLVAHNGTHFDFPLLRSELQRIGKQLPETLLCVDTLPGFRSQLKIFLEAREFLSELQNLEQYDALLNDGNDELLFLAAERLETLHNTDLDVTSIRTASHTEDELNGRPTTPRQSKQSGSLYWRQQANNTTPSKRRVTKYYSYKLEEIYKILFNETPVSHRAENDVINLMKCVHMIGVPFIDWMDKNCFEFHKVRLYC
ncbi:hypothetical protein M8J77_004097 [Diaphorina citri]|nr:hypothetical protein M8J77_004097 [Diaphorina citri]